MKISIGSDHTGFSLKEKIITWLSNNIADEILDFGTDSTDIVDYPEYAHAIAQSIFEDDCDYGILICNAGNDLSITANKWRDIRAAICWNSKIAELARSNNNCNILIIPSGFVNDEEAIAILNKFINTEFKDINLEDVISKINPTFV